jgi:DNA gyrase subunit B
MSTAQEQIETLAEVLPKKAARSYTANNVKVLEGLEAVRKRPGMYIGNTSTEGYHQLLYEIIDNCVDESFEGECRQIDVQLNADGTARVSDDGRGIPVELHEQKKKPTVEIVMTHLHAGAKFDSDAYKFSGGLHGVGLSVVNALSEWIVVDVFRDGRHWQLRCEKMIPVVFNDPETGNKTTLRDLGPTTKTGTSVLFKPDVTIFEVSTFSPGRIKNRLEELSYLAPGVTFTYRSDDDSITYYSENGIETLLDKLTTSPRSKPIVLTFSGSEEKLGHERFEATLKLAMVMNEGSNEKLITFANGIRTADGGTHATVVRSAFSRALSLFAKDRQMKIDAAVIEELRSDFLGVVEAKVSEPIFESQTKVKLKNSELQRIFLKDITMAFNLEFAKQEEAFEAFLKEAVEVAKKKSKLRDDISNLKKKMTRQQQTLPAKLSDCSSRKTEEREIFIVEGDSAGGSLKQCKDDKRQAVLPLRGKTLNTEKADFDARILQNEALLSIVSALGLQFEDTDYSKLRYSRVIIMTDADADGGHITILLLTFLHSYFPQLFADGKIFLAVPPLYRVTYKKKAMYLRDDLDLDKFIAKLPARERDRVEVQRFKGLGEMNPSQLWETCIDPAKRQIVKIDASDLPTVLDIIDITLGESAARRRAFIRENAAVVDETFIFEL